MDVGVCALGFVIARSALASSGLHRACARLRLRTRHRVIRVAHRRAVHYVRATRLQLPRSSPARPGHAARLCPSPRLASIPLPVLSAHPPGPSLAFASRRTAALLQAGVGVSTKNLLVCFSQSLNHWTSLLHLLSPS